MPARNTKNVALTDQLATFIDELVETGRYKSVSEVVRDGLRALQDRMAREAAELAEIQHRIGRSLDQLDRGEHAEGTLEEIFDRTFDRALDRTKMRSDG